MSTKNITSRLFFGAAAARFAYLWAINWNHGYEDAVMLALLGILAHLAFERGVA